VKDRKREVCSIFSRPVSYFCISYQAVGFVRFGAFTVVKIQVEVFWIVTSCGVALRNVGILPQHYSVPQPRRPRFEYRLLFCVGVTNISVSIHSSVDVINLLLPSQGWLFTC